MTTSTKGSRTCFLHTIKLCKNNHVRIVFRTFSRNCIISWGQFWISNIPDFFKLLITTIFLFSFFCQIFTGFYNYIDSTLKSPSLPHPSASLQQLFQCQLEALKFRASNPFHQLYKWARASRFIVFLIF